MTASLSPSPSFTLTFEDTKFALVRDVPALMQAIEASRCGALRFSILEYRQIRRQLQQSLREQFGQLSRAYMDLVFAPLHCAGCLWEFPDSYRDSLFLGPAQQQEGVSNAGDMPGSREFAQTGVCPLCGCSECVMLYEYYQLESIGQADIEAIRRYWQSQARRWWRQADEQKRACAGCSTSLWHDQGYVINNTLLCVNCVDQQLDTALEQLRGYPHALGNNLLRKARLYRE
jgi:hypothetical protein